MHFFSCWFNLPAIVCFNLSQAETSPIYWLLLGMCHFLSAHLLKQNHFYARPFDMRSINGAISVIGLYLLLLNMDYWFAFVYTFIVNCAFMIYCWFCKLSYWPIFLLSFPCSSPICIPFINPFSMFVCGSFVLFQQTPYFLTSIPCLSPCPLICCPPPFSPQPPPRPAPSPFRETRRCRASPWWIPTTQVHIQTHNMLAYHIISRVWTAARKNVHLCVLFYFTMLVSEKTHVYGQ